MVQVRNLFASSNFNANLRCYSFNEPLLYCDNGKSVDHVIKAHARLYHFYHEDLEGTGKFGIKFNDNFGIPKDPQNSSHVDATNHFNEFQVRACKLEEEI